MSYASILKDSPVRNILDNTVGATIFELSEEEWNSKEKKKRVLEVTEEIRSVLAGIDEKEGEPFRIVVMGELKAGKSTFINACAGKEVAYADVTEATAAISEFSYGPQEKFVMTGSDGRIIKEGGLDELLEIAEEKAEDGAYWEPVKKIQVTALAERFKSCIFVDTPGLLTVTKANEELTKQYVYQADYILWILNSKDLGNEEVNELIRRIHDLGKPMAAIVNKVDSQEEWESIEDYIADTYESCFQEIFFLSARMAFRGMEKGDFQMVEKSGFCDVSVFLDILGENAESMKKEAAQEAARLQLRRERDLHSKLKQKITGKYRTYKGDMWAIEEKRAQIHYNIEQSLQEWIETRFFYQEQQQLYHAQDEQFLPLLQQYSQPEFIILQLKGIYGELAEKIRLQWSMIENQLIVPFYEEYEGNHEEELRGKEELSKETNGKIGENVKKGAMAGMALAGFAAWFGPASAAITLSQALVAYVPVLAIGGGLLAYLQNSEISRKADMEREQRAREKERMINQLYEGILPYVKAEAQQRVLKQLDQISDHYYEEILGRIREMEDELHFCFEEPYYSQFMERLDTYRNILDEEIRRLEALTVSEAEWEEFCI